MIYDQGTLDTKNDIKLFSNEKISQNINLPSEPDIPTRFGGLENPHEKISNTDQYIEFQTTDVRLYLYQTTIPLFLMHRVFQTVHPFHCLVQYYTINLLANLVDLYLIPTKFTNVEQLTENYLNIYYSSIRIMK